MAEHSGARQGIAGHGRAQGRAVLREAWKTMAEHGRFWASLMSRLWQNFGLALAHHDTPGVTWGGAEGNDRSQHKTKNQQQQKWV